MASTLKAAVVVAALCALLVLTTGETRAECRSRCGKHADLCDKECAAKPWPNCTNLCRAERWSCDDGCANHRYPDADAGRRVSEC